MDLDETVLDNGGFQAMQVRSNIAFDQRLWDIWEEKNGNLVGLIPGAKDFILEANKLGVTVVYLSNRNDAFKAQTKAMLARLGILAQDDSHIKLATAATGSNKTSRRQEVEKDYTVVLLIGDNLRDFDDQFRCGNLGGKTSAELEAAIRERKDKVDAQRAAWGDRWIILPNPAYGEWTKPLGLGKRDLDRLVPQVEIAP
jgi:acid phosphatase